MNDSISRRRWFRFSLRTLLVGVTLLAVWLGWNVNAVHQRRAARKELEASGSTVMESEPGALPYHVPVGKYTLMQVKPAKPLGWLRERLGDRPVSAILVKKGRLTDAQLSRACELFPEANFADVPELERSSKKATTDARQ